MRKNSKRGMVSAKAIEKQLSSQQGGSNYLKLPSGVKMWKPTKTRHRIDIIPYEVTESGHPYADIGDYAAMRPVQVHFGLIDGKGLVSPLTVGGRDPVLAEYAAMKKSGEYEKEELKHLLPKRRTLFNVIDLDAPDEGIQVWDVSEYCFTNLLNTEIQENVDELGSAFNIEGGKTLKLRLEQKSAGEFKFWNVERIDFVSRDEDYDESIVDEAVNLDRTFEVASEEDLLEALAGGNKESKDDPDDEDDEEETARPPKRRGRPAKNPPPPDPDEDEDEDDEEEDDSDFDEDKDEDEDEDDEDEDDSPPADDDDEDEDEDEDDEEDEDEDEDDEEDDDEDEDDEEDDAPPPPRRGRGRPPAKKAPPVKDEDEDDDDDDEEDDTPPPPPKKRGRGRPPKNPPPPADDDDEEEAPTPPRRRRGRPPTRR